MGSRQWQEGSQANPAWSLQPWQHCMASRRARLCGPHRHFRCLGTGLRSSGRQGLSEVPRRLPTSLLCCLNAGTPLIALGIHESLCRTGSTGGTCSLSLSTQAGAQPGAHGSHDSTMLALPYSILGPPLAWLFHGKQHPDIAEVCAGSHQGAACLVSQGPTLEGWK